MPPPFELPAGCGDGVVVSGQYDCYSPIPLHWPEFTPQPLGEGFDVDGDGRQELVYDRNPTRMLGYSEQSGFVLGPGAEYDGGNTWEFYWRWDWDRDGRKDLTALDSSVTAEVYANASMAPPVPAAWSVVHTWKDEPLPNEGHAVPLDVDGDGVLELVVSHRLDPDAENSRHEITVRRRNGDGWSTTGPAYTFGGCGHLNHHAYGDVDGDGDLDLVIQDEATGCDPHPTQYDPEWHEVGVFLADGTTGELQLGGWFPTGTIPDTGWLEVADVDEDGIPDVLMHVFFPDEFQSSLGYLRGHGDGTFDDGVMLPLDRPDLPHFLRIRARGDLDGDGDVEWLALGPGPADTAQLFVIEPPLHQLSVTPFMTIEDPMIGYSHSSDHQGRVDFNGDGADDVLLTVGGFPPLQTTRYALLSAP